jgi:hypothetical protein
MENVEVHKFTGVFHGYMMRGSSKALHPATHGAGGFSDPVRSDRPLVDAARYPAILVVHHSDFDVLIPSHWRIGKLSGGTRISMLLGMPG